MSRKIDKTRDEWAAQLTPEQLRIARDKGTEMAFTGAYNDNKATGAYHCICCDAVLFDSAQKYDSGSGWPSFWAPADGAAIEEETDSTLGMVRTEVMCDECGAHLGHVFPDGPQPTGQRYCVNSGSLNFHQRDGDDT